MFRTKDLEGIENLNPKLSRHERRTKSNPDSD